MNRLSRKWAFHILREMNGNGPKRFGELLRGMKGVSPRTLSRRLKELEDIGMVSRKKFNEIPPKVEYSLTRKGNELIKCFGYLNNWARKFGAK